MVGAIRQTVTVQPDGRIEIRSPELRPGAQAEVIVLVEPPSQESTRSQLEALEKLQQSMNLTPEAAQKWIDEVRAEREAWGNRS